MGLQAAVGAAPRSIAVDGSAFVARARYPMLRPAIDGASNETPPIFNAKDAKNAKEHNGSTTAHEILARKFVSRFFAFFASFALNIMKSVARYLASEAIRGPTEGFSYQRAA